MVLVVNRSFVKGEKIDYTGSTQGILIAVNGDTLTLLTSRGEEKKIFAAVHEVYPFLYL